MEDTETDESLTVHVDRLAFSCPRLRDEIEPIFSFDSPFRSLSNPSLHDLFDEGPMESSNLPTLTPLHDATPRPGSLHFLDQPRAQS